MRRTVVVFVVCAFVGFCVTVMAQAPVARPVAPPVVAPAVVPVAHVLTDVQRLTVQNVLLELERAQLRAQLVIQGLQVPGYDLDLQTLTYRPKPVEAKK